MKGKILFLLLMITWYGPSFAADPKLTGTPIGCVSVDYDSGKISYTVNAPANAFDGKPSTFYASYDRSYTWVGLDLGSPHVITRIGYTPRSGHTSRLQLAVFEGANSPDFCDAVPLFIIPNTPSSAATFASVSCSRGFRYVRYVGPHDVRCNVAELAFYGHEGAGDDSNVGTLSGIPVVSIHTQGSKEITSRHTWLDGTVTIIWDEGRKILQDSLRVRGRGNNSWSYDKKPYRLKLVHKARPLDMTAKAKDWTLINNYGDKTLIRNLVAFDCAERLGMAWTPEGRMVDVLLNGEYKGTYQFCDQIEVHKDRVEVTHIDSPESDGTPETCGYLMEIDAYASGEPVWFTSEVNKMPVTIKYPDDDEIQQAHIDYLRTELGKLERLITSPTFMNRETGYAKMLDLDDFVKHFIVGEYSGNTDTYWSTYMWKERGDEHFHFGPVWDFDLGFENDSRTYPINEKNDFVCLSSGSSHATGAKNFVSRVIATTQNERKAIWSQVRYDGGLTPENVCAVVDSLASQISRSQKLNFTRWPIMNQKVHGEFQILGSFEAEVKFMEGYIRDRIAWLDNKIGLDIRLTDVDADVVPEGSVLCSDGMARLQGFPEHSLVTVTDLNGRLTYSTLVTDFVTDVPLPSTVAIVVVRRPDGSTQRFKVAG